MFICNRCKKPAGPKTQPVKITLENRKVTYKTESGISHGEEIVREGNFCPPCAGDLKKVGF